MTELRRADAVFEGGGVKGIGLVGALEVAEEHGYQCVNVAGTSAGAIVASLVASGHTAVEIKAIMDKLDYRKFQDKGVIDTVPVIGPLISLGLEKGIYEGKYLHDLISDLLARKGVRTFGDLVLPEFASDERYRFRLQVIASDVSRGRMVVLPRDAHKYGIRPEELSVADAVRMSMSIPFFFEPVTLTDQETREQSYIVDGGVLSNYPIWLFDDPGPDPEWPTFGFRLVEGDEGPKVVRHQIRGPLSLLAALFFTAMEAHDARYIEDQDWVRTIPIPTAGVSGTDFDLSCEAADGLYRAGRAAAEKFFQGWDFGRYVTAYRRDDSKHGRKLARQQLVARPE